MRNLQFGECFGTLWVVTRLLNARQKEEEKTQKTRRNKERKKGVVSGSLFAVCLN